jgi:hypothetical protein
MLQSMAGQAAGGGAVTVAWGDVPAMLRCLPESQTKAADKLTAAKEDIAAVVAAEH